MTLSEPLFFLFSATAVTAALAVILSKNPVHAVLSLVLSFFATAGIWLLAEAEFLAITLVVVYVGAVMVLFLFVVMMLDVAIEKHKSPLLRHMLLTVLTGGGLLTALVYWIWTANSYSVLLPYTPEGVSNVAHIGYALFTQHILPFEVAGILLLAAIIAAITLTFRGRQGANKSISPASQIRVRKEDRLKVLSMPSEGKP